MSYDEAVEEPVLFLDTLIDDFGCFQESPASIKHAKTGQYIVCNGNLADRDGIPIEDYIGLTAYDIAKILNWKQTVTKNAVAVDQSIISQKTSFSYYHQVILTHDQSISIEEVFKKPVFGRNNQVAAVLAYAHDITRHAHPFYLFNLYTTYHTTEEAIRRFLRYKKIDTVFDELPTQEELLTLIAMRDTQEPAGIARQLGYSLDQVKRYQVQLYDKLPVIGLRDVLMFLKWYGEDVGYDAVS